LHFGGPDVKAGVWVGPRAEADGAAFSELVDAFSRSHETQPHLGSRLKQIFGDIHSLEALFKDQRRKTLGLLSSSAVAEVEAAHRQIYGCHVGLMQLLINSGMALPSSLRAAAESALNSFLRETLAADPLEPQQVHDLLQQAKALEIPLDAATLEFVLKKKIETMAEVVAANVADISSIVRLQKAVALARSLPFSVDLWWVQTLCHEWIGQAYDEFLSKAETGNKEAQAWMAQVAELSEQLLFLHPVEEAVEVLPDSFPSN
jgi:hypothetical protein